MSEAVEIPMINEQKAQARQHKFRLEIGAAALQRGERLDSGDVPLFTLVDRYGENTPLRGSRDTRDGYRTEAAMFGLFLQGEETYYIAKEYGQTPSTADARLRQIRTRVANYVPLFLEHYKSTDIPTTLQTGIEAYWSIEFSGVMDRRQFVAKTLMGKFEMAGGDYMGLLCADNGLHSPIRPAEVAAQKVLKNTLVDYLQLVHQLKPEDRPKFPVQELEDLFNFLGFARVKTADGRMGIQATERGMSLMQFRSLARRQGVDADALESSLLDGLMRIVTPVDIGSVLVG